MTQVPAMLGFIPLLGYCRTHGKVLGSLGYGTDMVCHAECEDCRLEEKEEDIDQQIGSGGFAKKEGLANFLANFDELPKSSPFFNKYNQLPIKS